MMKLVLLPGLDGTGLLFKSFLSHLQGIDTQVISLPMEGDQCYETLTNYVVSKLPDEPFVLLAESFSGPIAARIVASGLFHIKRVIFVATFLTPPRRFILSLIRHIPLKRMMRLPFSDYAIKMLFVGRQSDKTLLDEFRHVLKQVPELILKQRISSIMNQASLHVDSRIDAVYVLPTHDLLVPRKSIHDFGKAFQRLDVRSIPGPHFILQANPKECADKLEAYLIDTPQ